MAAETQSAIRDARPAGASEVTSLAYIGRQAIVDRAQEVQGYELLFRPGNTDDAGAFDGQQATCRVLVNSLIDIGLSDIVGKHRAFFNFPRELLLDGTPQLLPRDQVVFEVLEDTVIDATLLETMTALARQGYTFALDDFVHSPKWDPLIPLVDFIKLDVQEMSRDQLQEHYDRLSGHRVKLLAEKVETHEEFETLCAMGFDLFQGYFFCRPKVISGARIPDNQLVTLQLLAALQNPDIGIKELETLLSQDLALSYKMLRWLNSPYFGLIDKIDSIRRVVVHFGIDNLARWATLMKMASFEDKPRILFETALIRAKTCETLAIQSKADRPASYFLVGLFSVLDAMFDRNIEAILAELPLAQDINDALVQKQGAMGAALRRVLACETCGTTNVRLSGVDDRKVGLAYAANCTWARETLAALAAC